jgi:hypothetical protein
MLQKLIIALLRAAIVFVATSASAQDLTIRWPDHWEYREPKQQGPAVYLQAREQVNGETLQRLEITAIDVRAAQKPITRESIKDLASRLRDAASATAIEKKIPLRQFASGRGYYFIATDRNFVGAKVNSFKQMIEGVMFGDGYLVSFTMLTNDAQSEDARLIVSAIGNFTIEGARYKLQ